jgi:uncharacterized protein (DUF2342 family)
MFDPRLSSPWLSDDMAQALAAACPPLDTTDVRQAADTLTTRSKPKYAMDHLLLQGAHLMRVPRVVEALCALRDVRE